MSSNHKGFTEDQLFEKFSKAARYMGGGCYSINYFNEEIFDTCTNELRKKYYAHFIKRDGRYYYS